LDKTVFLLFFLFGLIPIVAFILLFICFVKKYPPNKELERRIREAIEKNEE